MCKILGIESSCDETACSIVEDGTKILSNVVSSQVDIHKVYGGVVPEIASRQHVERMIPVIDESLRKANISIKDVDYIAVTSRPGLIGSLFMGVCSANAIAWAFDKPLIPINHLEGHLYSSIMEDIKNVRWPALGVIISGGHTMMVVFKSIGEYEVIATTVDDAIGESFDKVATFLGLSYPGGPAIEALSKNGNKDAYKFKAGTVKNNELMFSFSGLKTAVMYSTRGDFNKYDVAASFQFAAVKDLTKKAKKAINKFDLKSVVVGGGVSCNKFLKNYFIENIEQPIFFPKGMLALDNAAMIAGLAYYYRNNTVEFITDVMSSSNNTLI